jgi:ABC-2 type transport system ATP-binding protein
VTTSYTIETAGLTKRYSDTILAVDELALQVRPGEVYGFVGPNGSGKTTTLRMLVGLVRPTAGSARVLGHQPGAREALARVGAVIEEPAFYPYLSGRDNLRVMADHAGCPHTRIESVLETVELSERAGDPFRTYSMGMKQRLGLAAALLKDPAVLILDEPTNGLDPNGIADMRRLIRSLGSGERTVLLSSHLMTEVEAICDRIGVIRKGRLVAEGTLDELRGRPELRVRAHPLEAASEAVARLPFVEAVRRDDGALLVTADLCRAGQLNRHLLEAGIEVCELTPVRSSLEDIFLELVDDRERDGTEGRRG